MPTVYATAQLCGKWTLPFYAPIAGEDTVATHQRSYLHYVASHVPLVAAKCLATEWLLATLQEAGVERVREYFGGVGICTVILRALLAPKVHLIGERDTQCVAHLAALMEGTNAVVRQQDAKTALLTPGVADLHMLDFPAFSALHLATDWRKQFLAVFASKPRAVVWTDTAVSYLPVHRAKYAALFESAVLTPSDYTKGLSTWLAKEFGYSITRAAYRGRNAVYYLAQEHDAGDPQEGFFPLKGSEHGFVWT
jgi:hypothetical protein